MQLSIYTHFFFSPVFFLIQLCLYLYFEMQFTRRLKKIIAHQNQTTNPALQEFQHL